jgi:Zn-dependent protease
MVPPLVCPPDGLPPLGVDRGRNHLHTIAGVILGGTLGVLILRAGGNALAFDLLFLAGWLVATALHEFGHATAAYARGFRVISIVIGPVFVTRAARKGFRLGVRPALLGGWVLSAPRRWDGDRRYLRDKAWVVAAGPAVSLVVGAVGLLLSRPWTVLWEWSVISLVIGVVTLIPMRYPKGRSSDGEKLRRLREAEPADLALMALHTLLFAVRPRDWDPALVDVARAESESGGSGAIDGTLLLYFHVLDSGDAVGAGALLQRLIDYTCGTARWPRTTISLEVALEASLFEAVWRGDEGAAREWLARAPFDKKRESVASIASMLAKLRQSDAPCYHATIERLSSSSSG